MNARPTRLRRFAWLAILATLAMALMPTVSHALAHWRGQASWVEVCTTAGSRLVALDAAGEAQQPATSAAAHLEHCPYCAPSFGGVGLPPSPLTLPLPADLATEVPALFLQAPRTLHAWCSAQPRAPPSLS